MNVLIYTGYQPEAYNSNTLNHKGLGGTEQCCIYLAKYFKNFGWNVIVGGDVIEDNIDGVQWLTNQTIHKTMFNKFDFIIGASYIHFLKEFEKYNCKKIFWAHNTDYHPCWRGKEIPHHRELLDSPELDKIVCLTNWHKKQWSSKYNLSLDKFKVIGNGIETVGFNKKIKKQLGKIIWSSAPERGLIDLLINWKKIKSVMPHAELHVFTPSYCIKNFNIFSKINLKDVYFRGNVSPSKLHEEMLSSEYWIYLTEYEETYCITAIEMQLASVFPITTNAAALGENIINGLIVNDNANKWNVALSNIKNINKKNKNNIIKENIKISKQKTWLMRSMEWKELIYSI